MITQTKKDIRTYSFNKALIKKNRQKIVNCAKHMFYEKGYVGTSMRELAKACHLTTGAIYNYLGSKADILHMIAGIAEERAIELNNFDMKLKNKKPTEALKAVMGKYFRIVNDDSDITLFFNREIASFSKEDRDFLLKGQVHIVQVFMDLLNRGIEAGEFKVDMPVELLAHNIMMLGQDYAMRRWFLRKKYPLDDYIKFQTDSLLNQIVKK